MEFTDEEIKAIKGILLSSQSIAGFQAANPSTSSDERKACYKMHMRCTAALKMIEDRSEGEG